MAEKNPCADVRVNEADRIKINFEKFLDHFLPNQICQKLKWPCPVENIVDVIIISLANKNKSLVNKLSLAKWSCDQLYKKEEMLTKNENKLR